MIDIPLGKALVAVKVGDDALYRCQGCVFTACQNPNGYCSLGEYLSCDFCNRKDGKDVIFKLVDYPAKESCPYMEKADGVCDLCQPCVQCGEMTNQIVNDEPCCADCKKELLEQENT